MFLVSWWELSASCCNSLRPQAVRRNGDPSSTVLTFVAATWNLQFMGKNTTPIWFHHLSSYIVMSPHWQSNKFKQVSFFMFRVRFFHSGFQHVNSNTSSKSDTTTFQSSLWFSLDMNTLCECVWTMIWFTVSWAMSQVQWTRSLIICHPHLFRWIQFWSMRFSTETPESCQASACYSLQMAKDVPSPRIIALPSIPRAPQGRVPVYPRVDCTHKWMKKIDEHRLLLRLLGWVPKAIGNQRWVWLSQSCCWRYISVPMVLTEWTNLCRRRKWKLPSPRRQAAHDR